MEFIGEQTDDPKVLGALAELCRCGGTRVRRVDLRLIAAAANHAQHGLGGDAGAAALRLRSGESRTRSAFVRLVATPEVSLKCRDPGSRPRSRCVRPLRASTRGQSYLFREREVPILCALVFDRLTRSPLRAIDRGNELARAFDRPKCSATSDDVRTSAGWVHVASAPGPCSTTLRRSAVGGWRGNSCGG